MKVNDTFNYIVTSINPPILGEAYIDPVFDTQVRRISNALLKNTIFIGPEYSTVFPFNVDDRYLLLLHFDHFAIYEYDGRGYTFLYDLSNELNARSEPRWTNDSNIFSYYHFNQIKYYDVRDHTIHEYYTFSEYEKIESLGEFDPAGGDYLVIMGVRVDSGAREVFLFDARNEKKYKPFNIGDNLIDNLYLTSINNNVLIGWKRSNSKERFYGIELYDHDMNFIHQVTQADGHKDVLKVGDKEFIAWCSSNEIRANGNYVMLCDINDLNQRNVLISLDWSTIAFHISAALTGKLLISTYSQNSTKAAWQNYDNELFTIDPVTKEIQRICHHHSVPLDDYTWQPEASINRDGTRLVFSSNYGLRPHDNYVDTYFVQLDKVADQTLKVPMRNEIARFKIKSDKEYSLRFEFDEAVIVERDKGIGD